MKKTVKFLSLIIIMVLFSCSKEPAIDVAEESIAAEQLLEIKSKTKKTSIAVRERPGGFPNGDFLVIDGATSTLKRTQNGITVNLKTNGLIPNNAYTMWFVVFGDAPGPPTSNYAAGHIVGGSGKGNFSAHKSVGPDFDNPLTAEVHVVIRSHGQAVPGMIPDQIHTFEEGCITILPQGPGRIWADSDELGRCANVQLAIHEAVD